MASTRITTIITVTVCIIALMAAATFATLALRDDVPPAVDTTELDDTITALRAANGDLLANEVTLEEVIAAQDVAADQLQAQVDQLTAERDAAVAAVAAVEEAGVPEVVVVEAAPAPAEPVQPVNGYDVNNYCPAGYTEDGNNGCTANEYLVPADSPCTGPCDYTGEPDCPEGTHQDPMGGLGDCLPND